jgi:hypothetical protein
MKGNLKQVVSHLLNFRAILLGISLFNLLSEYVSWGRIYSHDPPMEVCCGAGLAPLLMVLGSILLQFRRAWTDLIALAVGIALVYDNSYRVIANYADLFGISMWNAVVRWLQFVSADLHFAFDLLFGVSLAACAIISVVQHIRRGPIHPHGDA